MLYILCFYLLIAVGHGVNYDFLLADGPTYASSNNTYYFPYGDPKYGVEFKLLKVDPHTGLWIVLLRGRPGDRVGTHRHYGEVYAYTLKGAWGYIEHPEWISKSGDIVHEAPGSVHTFYIHQDYGDTELLAFLWGPLEYLDEFGNTIAIEDWRSILKKNVDYCQKNNLPIVDVTYPKQKVKDVEFNKNKNKSEL
ncbi:unnamed protein product [Rotaria sp. Silwood1]|nr:unnamed protein product [Rotaria sp. Silwood1]CAF3871136.1 unnamed protein product [Rotaria sp. Silwood1]CAF3921755.1 unnamed protein product [Rotaria sp. Silwood1]CAF4962961.1 unnamed protein product [Rotaria sp. Silwood1]CAF5042772.1 unnamed protein product [Rotaria sp. Silwood1]